jgi:rifampicin phosphotransferase
MSDMVISFDELTADQRSRAGGKGGSLARLAQAGYPVPDGFVLLPCAFAGDELLPAAWAQVRGHLDRLRGTTGNPAFAVRSSAMSEDSAQASFAGEFETVLNVSSDDDIRRAIHTVVRSRQNERVRAYSEARGMSAVHEISVIVQRLARAECSGVLFTANPVTGQRDQAMISAAWGLGEAIVGGLVTPDTLIVDKQTGRVAIRETADKQVMTVRLESGTEEQPVPEAKRRSAVLSDRQAGELVRLGVGIEALYGMPVDIEWVLEGDQIAIVQARPITALPEPEPLPPTEWKLPKGQYIAMRNNIVELMADPLTPLFRTLDREAINASMGRLLTNFFGKPMMPEELIVTVNSYAYYNGSMTAGQMAQVLLGSVGILKRMFAGAVERWTESGRPHYVATVALWRAQPWRELSSTELLDAVRELSEAAIDAYGALVSGVIPAAWISEALFTFVYSTLIRRRDDPSAPTFLMGFDSLPIRAEKSLYDLAKWALSHVGLATYLSDTLTPQIVAQLDLQAPLGVDAADWHEWKRRFQAHLGQYGHTIYNLDFWTPVPADDPAPLLETLKLFLSGRGVSPHARQQSFAERREQANQALLERLRGVRLTLFRTFVARAQRYAPLREDGLADVGLSYPLLRNMLHELGHRFAEGGLIQEPDDIYWLDQERVAHAATRLDKGKALKDQSTIVARCKATWRAARRTTPPIMLPQIKLFGLDLGEIRSGRARGRRGNTLKGVAASPGSVTAPACVLSGPEDFGRMKTGDVLVAPLTTPAWTPLFARAAAVVTDVGGPLSHGSIVAREYGIPAVLGTGAATKRIRSGQMVTVDGSTGLVTLSRGDELGG